MTPSSSVRPVPVPRAPSPRDTAWLEAFEEHLRHERNRSPQTVRAYLADLRALIDHVAGTAGTAAAPAVDDDAPARHVPSAPDVLAELDIEDLRGWLAAMSGAGLARATLARRVAAVRTFTAWLRREGLRSDDPALRLRSPRPEGTLPHVLQEQQATRLLAAAQERVDAAAAGDDPAAHALALRDAALLELLYATGARVAELSALGVDDLDAVDDQVLKLAIYDFDGGEEHTAVAFADLRETHQVVVSGLHWVDIMNTTVNKGVALRNLQAALGVTPAQTAAFGDYLNDLQLLQAADWSYAMADAHPDVAAVARFRAGSNAEAGVLTAIEQLIG